MTLQVRFVLSWPLDSFPATATAAWQPPLPTTTMAPLTKTEGRDIVIRQLEYYRKRLTPGQSELLLAKQEAYKPLFLITSCEELRLQAQYGLGGTGVDEFIRCVRSGACDQTRLGRCELTLAPPPCYNDGLQGAAGHNQRTV